MARSKSEKLMERIDECNRYKELVANYPDKFNLKNLTQKQWLKYYDEEVSHCIKQLESEKSSLKAAIIFSLIAIILLSSFLVIKPNLTTLAIFNPESINFEINKTVSLESYILINSGSFETRINISEFNLPIENGTYSISSLNIPLTSLNLPPGDNLVAISLIDNNEVKEIKQISINVEEETTTTQPQYPIPESSTSTTLEETTSTTLQINQTTSTTLPSSNLTNEINISLETNTTPIAQTVSSQSQYNIQTIKSNLSQVYLTLNGRLTYNNDTLAKNQAYNFTFSIYNKNQNMIWQENQTINISSGLYSAILGTSSSLNIQFNESYSLGISINDSSPPTQELLPRLNLTHVPYAYRSNVADDVECTTCVDWYTEIQNLPPGITNGTTVLTINSTGSVDAGAIKSGTLDDQRISSNFSKRWDSYSVNQTYNKSEVEQIFVNQSGDTISGNITITGNLSVTSQTYLSNLTISGATSAQGNITTRSIIPVSDVTQDLGNSLTYFRNLYINRIYLDILLTGSQITSETITSTNIQDEAVGTAEIQNLSIQSIDIASYQINNTHITLNSVNGSQIAIFSINNSHLSPYSINNTQLGLNSVNTSQILDETISGADIQNLSIQSIEIGSYQINNTHIVLYSVNGSQIAINSINDSQITNVNVSKLLEGRLPPGVFAFQQDLVVNGSTFYINSTSQFIGIGIQNPNATLEVADEGGENSPHFGYNKMSLINIHNDNSANNGGHSIGSKLVFKGYKDSGLSSAQNIFSLGVDVFAPIVSTTEKNNFFIQDEYSSTRPIRFFIDGNGNIGVGTTSPSARLDVQGNISLNNTLYVLETRKVGINNSNPTKVLDVIGDVNLSNTIYISGQSVGIGTSIPSHTLNVVGSANITNNLTVGNLTVNQYATFKDNITVANITPSSNNTASLGSNQTFFKEVYINLLHIITQITGMQIASETITSSNIKDENVGTAEIQNLSIQSIDIASYQINNTHITLNAVNGSQIAIFSINNSHISLNSINTSQIVDGTINQDDINQNSNLRIANLTIDNNLTVNNGLLILDALNKRVGIGTSNPNATLHIVANDTNNASITAIITLDNDIPAYIITNGSNGTGLGIMFRGKDSIAEMENISQINAVLINAQNGTETSSIEFLTRNKGGQLTPKLTITGEGVINITNNLTVGNLTVNEYALFKNNITVSNITAMTNNTLLIGSSQSFFKEIYVNILNIITKITGIQIADETITAINIQNKTIQSGDIGDAEINATHIKDEAVGTAEIQNLSIQSIDIASYQINNTHITLNAINGSQIAIFSINNTHISLNSINGSQIIQLSINNSHIASFSINNTQLGLNSINTSQIVDGAIQGSDINSNTNITLLDLISNGQASLANVTITNNLTIGTQTLVAITNGTTNKVGINLTSPTTALDINGVLNLSSTTSGKLLQIGSGVHSNITMFSVDGTRWTCGILNSGAMNCTSF